MNLRLFAIGVLVIVSMVVACSSDPTPTQSAQAERPRTTPTPTGVPAGQFSLTILHNNDGESRLVDLGPDLEDFGGVANFAAVVQREKRVAASDGLITLTAGDNFLAGPEFTAGRQSGTFYDALALDLIGYDAIGLGNHDFDFGPEVLADFIRQVSNNPAPFLSSNLDFSQEPLLRDLLAAGRIAKSVVVEKNGESIGIIGAILPTLDIVSSPRRVRIIRDVAGAVQAEVDRLEAIGVNKIVLISHQVDLDADIALLGQLHGIDVVVAGGEELLANECDLLIPGDDTPFGPYPMIALDQRRVEVPVVTTAGQYSYLGKLAVTFDANGRLVDVDQIASGPIRIARRDNPSSVQAAIDTCKREVEFRDSVQASPLQREVISPLQRGLDQLGQPIARTQVPLDGRRSEVRSRETTLGNLMADALLWQAGRVALDYDAPVPDVALLNSGAIRNDSILPAGQIRELDTFAMAPFANMVTIVERISKSQLKELVENAVSRVVEGDTVGGTGRFAQVSGFSFEWSASGTAQVLNPDGSVRTPGTRVRRMVLNVGEVVVDGGRVVPGRDVTVATLDFVARGGDEFPFRGATFTSLGVTYQQALANYLRSRDGLSGTVAAADYPEGGEGRIRRSP